MFKARFKGTTIDAIFVLNLNFPAKFPTIPQLYVYFRLAFTASGFSIQDGGCQSAINLLE
jgi:hypothetical protein